ncbi:tyrosine-type recombinase/integrase [Dyella caseinilytica]|uniref:Tyrosine-type recombinase/integrase n=1 Tax=Dyella caseinilytica TaxID=1849581 RepID=A0ABX7GPA1_9GAMM|nr:integrase arm-type DNA-binding domain-containing protein [Dyella caseinilytica]QRN52223.1 tyrosine-type recombinase/integrase [Dyella caseinilytica]GGA14188.1 integrase [Dyella caseinilytica]
MSLTDTGIRKAKPSDKPQKLADGGGLYLLLNPNGSRWWRYKFRFEGKEKLLSLGTYPETSLAEARDRHAAARKQLQAGIDPGAHRKAEKVAGVERAANSFAVVAEEWLAKQQNMSAATLEKARWTFDSLVNPWIGSRPISEIDAPEMLKVLQRIEERGAHETAHRTKQRCGQIFRYAIATGRARHDPTADLRGALTPAKVKHRAAITDPAKMGELLRAIDGYTGGLVVRTALKLAPLLFVRPGELRQAEWKEFDLDVGQWRIPANKMKMREPHIVPLPDQAVSTLQELQPLTGRSQYVFPGERSRQRPMSDAAINAALRRMGFDKDTMTGHGFRAMASTRLNEMGWSADVIERQLAHAERNKVRAAYNRAQYLTERKSMMQAWADYLDGLRAGNVVGIHKKRSTNG